MAQGDDQESETPQWREAMRRAAIVRGLLDAPSVDPADIAIAAAREGVSRATLYRWIRRWREGERRTSSLVDGPRGPRHGGVRLAEAAEAAMARTIATCWRRAERPRPAAIVREVREACVRAGLPPPGENTIRRRLRAHGQPFEHEASGRRVVDRRRTRPTPGAFPATVAPLEIVQIDHTLVDVIVVDACRREAIGRPWLTVAIDVTSRVVAGFHLALDPPSAMSVALCLAQLMAPKETWIEARGLAVDWPVHGRPLTVHCDNAREFHGRALRAGCAEHGVALRHRPRGQPHFGGHVERLIGTMMGDVHLLPGTTQSCVAERSRSDPAVRAQLTLGELERWLTLAIDVYHRRVHAGLGTPPLARWEGLLRDADPATLARLSSDVDAQRILVDFLPFEMRRVTRTGVHLFTIAYWSDALRPLVGRSERFAVRYDPRDLSRVWLRAPDGEDVALDYRRRDRPPISLYEHRALGRRLRAEGRRCVDEALLFERHAQMRAVVDLARETTRAARRSALRSDPPAVRGPPSSAAVSHAEENEGAPAPPERLFDVEEW